MDKKIIIYIIIIFVFYFNNKVLCQQWQNNYISEYFSDKPVEDFSYMDSTLWIISDFTLYKCGNNSITSFNFKKYSNGCIYNYIYDKNITPDNIIIRRILIKNNKIWMWYFDSRDTINTFYMITNDTIHTVTFTGKTDSTDNNGKKFRFWYDLNVLDEQGNMNILMYRKRIGSDWNSKRDYTLFYSNGKDNFKQKDLSLNIEYNYYIRDIKFNNNKIYLSVEILDGSNLNYRLLFLNDIDSPPINSLSIKSDTKLFFPNDSIDNNVYILSLNYLAEDSSEGFFSIVDTNMNIRSYKLFLPLNGRHCFWFVVNNNDIYISSLKGLIKYELKSERTTFIEELLEGRYKVYNLSFRNLTLINNQIIGNYYGKEFWECQLIDAYGIYFLNLENE
ncbi:MAG TPA: hypothetical protein VIK14_13995 [Ignavibacteria bacterium]